jgi:hypothetical protein
VGSQPRFQPVPPFQPMRGPPTSSRPAGQLTPGVRRCHAGRTRRAAMSPLSSFSFSPFPLYSLSRRATTVERSVVQPHRRGRTVGCFHASRVAHRRPLYLPPPIKVPSRPESRTLASWGFPFPNPPLVTSRGSMRRGGVRPWERAVFAEPEPDRVVAHIFFLCFPYTPPSSSSTSVSTHHPSSPMPVLRPVATKVRTSFPAPLWCPSLRAEGERHRLPPCRHARR